MTSNERNRTTRKVLASAGKGGDVDEQTRRRIERGPRWWRKIKASLLWDLLRAQKWWVRGMVLSVVLGILTQLVITMVIRGMVDQGLVDQTVPLGDYLVPAVLFALLLIPVNFVTRQVGQRVGFHMEYDLRTRLYRSFQSADLQRLDRMASGQLITRAMTDLTMVERMMQFLPTLFAFVPVIIGMGIFLIILNPLMGVLAAASFPLNIWLLRRFKERLWGLSWSELNERAEVTAAVDEPVRGIRVVKAFGREEHERERLERVSLRAYQFAMSRWRLLARFDVPMKFAPIVTQAIILLLGAQLVADGSLSLGTFLIAFQVVGGFTAFAGMIDEVASAWQYLRSAQSRIGEVIDMATASAGGAPLPEPSHGLRLEGVGVELGGRMILADLHLTAAPGQLVVVHGAPGSGKSTLAAVAAGILEPHIGLITLDGADPRDLDADAVRRAVRVVAEEPFLFATSVRENLEIAVQGTATDDDLQRALWAAAADEFVAELSGGLDSHIGDRGLTLSGGQRQRLALARALVSPPRVLVLDDALSAVNPSLEVEILRRIRTVAPDTAVICISRRAGATTVADEVVTLPDPLLVPNEPVEAEVLALAPVGAAEGDMSTLQSVVAALKLSDERPDMDEHLVTEDSPVRPRVLGAAFKSVIALAAAALTVQTLGRFAPELLFGNVADVVQDGHTGDAAARSGLLVIAGLVAALGSYFFRIHSQRFNQGVMYVLRRRVFQRLSKLGVDHYDREMPGQVAARIVNDLDVISTFLQSTVFMAATQLARMFIGMTLIVIISPATFPVVAGVAVVISVLAVAQFPATTRAFNAARDELGHVVTRFEEDFTARHDIRSFGAREKQTEKFIAAAWRLRGRRRRATALANGFSVMIDSLGHVAAALVLYRSGNLVLAGSISVGSALTLRLLATEATQPLTTLGRVYGEFLNVRVSWNRLKEPYDVPVLPVERRDARTCDTLAGAVRFAGVEFTYPHTGRQVLYGLDFVMPAGAVIGLVGYTGAGKSSIAKLLTRTYDPDRGAVTVDGTDLREYFGDDYRRHVGVVPQDAFVFRGTVASNIAYGHLGASQLEIEEAARAVGAQDVLASLPGGYEHPVEEEGKNLTAAQRQLIALARAWIAQPEILVLDEATSCLDAALERKVLEAVGSLGCTTLMVTHRDNVAAACDHVIVLDAGRVVEEGPPDELIGAGGAYDRLWVVDPAPGAETTTDTETGTGPKPVETAAARR